RPTTLAFVKLVSGQATYTFYDELTAGRMLSADDLPESSRLSKISLLFFGGISLVNSPAAAAYEALQTRESSSRLTMADPNIRPGLITGKEAEYRERIWRMTARADIVKVSEDDLNWLLGAGDSYRNMQEIIGKGPRLVFLTNGEVGARAMTATQDRFMPAKR